MIQKTGVSKLMMLMNRQLLDERRCHETCRKPTHASSHAHCRLTCEKCWKPTHASSHAHCRLTCEKCWKPTHASSHARGPASPIHSPSRWSYSTKTCSVGCSLTGSSDCSLTENSSSRTHRCSQSRLLSEPAGADDPPLVATSRAQV